MVFKKGNISWNKSKKLSKKHKENISVSRSGKGLGNKNATGYKLTENHIEKLKKALAGNAFAKGLKHPHTQEAKNKISEKASLRIIAGFRNYTRGLNGYYYSEKNQKQLWYRSSWELQAYKILEQMSGVKSYEPEPFYIPYEFNRSIHNYIPDILVTYTDSSQELIEIKPKYKLQDEQIIAKINAGKQYAIAKGISFNIWDDLKIKEKVL